MGHAIKHRNDQGPFVSNLHMDKQKHRLQKTPPVSQLLLFERPANSPHHCVGFLFFDWIPPRGSSLLLLRRRPHSLTHSLTHPPTHARTHALTHSLTAHSLLTHCSLTAHSLTHSLTPSLTHSLTHSLPHSLTHSLPLADSLTH